MSPKAVHLCPSSHAADVDPPPGSQPRPVPPPPGVPPLPLRHRAPAASASSPRALEPPTRAASEPELLSLEGVRVVLVDDHAQMRRAVGMLLGEAGAQVVGELADGDGADDLVAPVRADVVVTDLVMPRVGGLEVVRRVRAVDAAVGVVVFTGAAMPGSAGHAQVMAAGADALVPKGVLAIVLLQAVADAAASARSRRM